MLLIDNCSAHQTTEALPQLNHVKVVFFSANATSKPQSLDDDIFAVLKVQYRHLRKERAVDLSDVGEMDICKNGVLTAMRWLTYISNALSADRIRNCCGTTRIVSAYNTVEPTLDLMPLMTVKKGLNAFYRLRSLSHRAAYLLVTLSVEMTLLGAQKLTLMPTKSKILFLNRTSRVLITNRTMSFG